MFAVVITAQVITLAAYLLAINGKFGTEQKTSLVGLLIEFMFLVAIFYAVTWFTGYNTFLFAGLVFAFSTPFLLMLNPELHHSNLRIGIMLTAGFSFGTFGVIRFIEFLKKYPKLQDHE